jgi:hypothetical protein
MPHSGMKHHQNAARPIKKALQLCYGAAMNVDVTVNPAA